MDYNCWCLYRNSKSSQDVVDFINCRISEKSVYGPPTADDLVAICKSVSVEFMLVTSTFGPSWLLDACANVLVGGAEFLEIQYMGLIKHLVTLLAVQQYKQMGIQSEPHSNHPYEKITVVCMYRLYHEVEVST